MQTVASETSKRPNDQEVDNARSLLKIARGHIIHVIALHQQIDGMRLMDEVTPGEGLLNEFTIQASEAMAAIEAAADELSPRRVPRRVVESMSLDAAAEE